MTTTIALGIPHSPWIPERVKSLARLEHDLRYDNGQAEHARVFADRAANATWSFDMWQWGAVETGASHFLTLQDDALVAPNFWSALRAMLEAVPDELICLETVHPAASSLALEGHHWCTTADAVIGVGYALPTELLREFLRWRRVALKPGAVLAITEDTLLGLWCLVTGRRVWHPIPTILDHDTTIRSTYGNDGHEHRRPLVTWRELGGPPGDSLEALSRPEYWLDTPSHVPHLGRFYASTPALAREWVEGFSEADQTRATRDNGAQELRRLAHSIRARTSVAPKARVLVCTPTVGGTHPCYNSSIWKLAAVEAVDVSLAFELVAAWQWTGDLVRVRSRFVRTFLETDATHLLFVDADVSFEPALVLGMIAAGRDFIAAPYPKRGSIDFEAVANDDGRPPEARAYAWPIRRLAGDGAIDEQACTEVDGLGLGCALLSRACLERMVEHYRADLEFDDVVGGTRHPTVALFQLPIRNRELLSEDHAFAMRWREMGGQVWMYLGPGSPATHHGDHTFRGHVEAFGVRRVDM